MSPELEHDEIDVTELIGRIENLEKENTKNKENIENQGKRITELESFAETATDTLHTLSRRR